MRTVAYTLHHSLTTEAATTVKQALTLARRRGHAQVTPLHVATAMLSSPTCLLRKACLQANSHPLQCKALELCFNVALNRLPTSASSPVLAPHHPHNPSMSNSLVAAFKRAQAHQRRGSVENQQQQQPILALKVEIEQLIISILDDPSVSRVMREAGFSSTRVKHFVEQAVCMEIRSQSSVMTSKASDQVRASDVMGVVETMMGKKRKNSVVVGECLASAEGVIRGVIDKFERGNEIPEELKSVEFVSLPLFSLRNLSREEVEEKIWELRCLVKRCVFKGIVLYLGDLKWVSEFWSNYDQKRNISYYSPVEHMIMEVSRILCGIGDSVKLWVMGVATFNTYMRCKIGHPSLETLWELYPLTIPIGSLGLTLKLESDSQDQYINNVSREGFNWLNKTGLEKHLTCCADCSNNFTREAQRIVNNIHENESTITSSNSSLPSWLQQYKEQNRKRTLDVQEYEKVKSLSKKWNLICSSIHEQPHFLHKTIHFSPPPSSASMTSKLNQRLVNWPVILEPIVSPKEHQFFVSENYCEGFESELKTMKPDLLSNPNSSPNSASCSEVSEGDMELLNGFKEFNSENMKILSNALNKKVPWQRGVIPEIASTILQCRAGMMRRKGDLEHKEKKEETWLFFLGVDSQGKEKIARELAKLVFGSKGKFTSMGLSSFSLTRADSIDQEFSNKRSRNEMGQSYLERFASEVRDNPRRVFFMEDVEQVDYFSQLGIKKAIESGRISLPSGEFVLLKDAIVIFSCESFSSGSRACSPPIRPKYGENEERDTDNRISLDLNMATEVDNGDDQSVSDIGILDSVDKHVIFKIQTP
ncbi:hypothetical protein LguiA_031905 [Lonicera macranthoides]